MMKLKFIVIALVMICAQFTYGQTKSVSGTVSDDSGIPIPGVAVLIAGTTNGVNTDFDGLYTLNNVSPTDEIVFSYIGMTTIRILVGDKTKIDVTLKESAEALSEVVVIGYGTQSRQTVTGAISVVDSEEISVLPVTNAESALQGRAAGVTVANSGVPGSTPSVLIRGLSSLGSNSPLYVIDGVIVGNLSGISPNDIESISVLKDAATTSIYGAQGSNGVIIVTTKKGRKGKGELSFNTYVGFQNVTKRYDVLGTIDYLKYASELGVFPNRPLETFQNETDWQDEIFTTGILENYNVSYQGGGEKGNYFFSAEYLGQEGTLINTDFERYSFRANSSHEFGKLKVGQTMSVALGNQSPELNSGGRTVIEHAIKSAPYLNVFNPNNLGGFQGPSSAVDGQDAENPVRVQTLGDYRNKSLGIIGNVYAELQLIEGLTFRSSVGLDYFEFKNRGFLPSYSDDSVPGSTTHAQPFAAINRSAGQGQTIIFNNQLRYKTTINEVHNIEALVFVEKFESKFSAFGGSSRNTVTDEIDQLTNEFTDLGSQSNETNKLGYSTRLDYNYDSKYILGASFRRDASSRFGSNKRWANFYAVSAGWNMANEDFMSNSAFNTLKLRGSYGTVGSDAIGDYRYAPSLASGFEYVFDDQVGFGVTSNGGENPNLQWEEKEIFNVGLDIGLFNNKFTAALEYYKNTSNDLLLNVPVALDSGSNSSTIAVNAGSVETSGFEITLGYNDYEGDFQWSANLNVGTTKNEVINLAGLDFIDGSNFKGGGNISRTIVGESLFHFYGLVSDGIYQNQAEVDAVFFNDLGQTTVQPGDIRFKDKNMDGTINSEDREIIGNPFPDVTGGLNLSASYKNFDFNMFITGTYGNEIFNTNTYDLVGGANRLFNVSQEYYENKWSPINPTGSEPRILGAPQNNGVSDRFVEDGSYTRLKNVSIGYTLPKATFEKYFSSLRIYISGQNLITITDYSGLDPEIGGGEFGVDRGRYPQPESVLFGIQAKF